MKLFKFEFRSNYLSPFFGVSLALVYPIWIKQICNNYSKIWSSRRNIRKKKLYCRLPKFFFLQIIKKPFLDNIYLFLQILYGFLCLCYKEMEIYFCLEKKDKWQPAVVTYIYSRKKNCYLDRNRIFLVSRYCIANLERNSCSTVHSSEIRSVCLLK